MTAEAVNIDLNDFFSRTAVTVAPDGSSALMEEDPNYFAVILTNDPSFGDPFVIFAPGILPFDYNFNEGAGGNDEFKALVLEAGGSSAGPAFEFFNQDSSSGTVSFDLASLVSEPVLRLHFQLERLVGDMSFSSTVTISNVCLQTPVPEPSTMLLIGTGLVGLVGLRRKFRM